MKIKNILRKSQAQFHEKWRELRLHVKRGFLKEKRECFLKQSCLFHCMQKLGYIDYNKDAFYLFLFITQLLLTSQGSHASLKSLKLLTERMYP